MAITRSGTEVPKLSAREITHVYRRIQGGTEVAALRMITLDVAENEIVTVIGTSGCGKSTLLRILAGIVQPTAGTVYLDGRPVSAPAADRGMVFQQDAIFPWLTVRGNIEYGPRCRGVSAKERHLISDRWMELVGLADVASAYPKELSGGMRKRVDVARVYANDPAVLLMDEPFGALDAQTKIRMQEELLAIWERERKTIVFVTHDLEEAIFLSDVVFVMTPRGGTFGHVERITLPRPRSPEMRFTAAFLEIKRALAGRLG